MKRVFSSNSQLCHVFVNQSQSEGRANNIFFRYNRIYSYGTHFLAGVIHTNKLRKILITNSKRYSVSTARHLNDIGRASYGLMPQVESSNPECLNTTLKELTESYYNSFKYHLKRKKFVDDSAKKWVKESIGYKLISLNQLRAFLGKKPLKFDNRRFKLVEQHIDARIKRNAELNTPEMIQRRNAERVKREARQAEKERLIQIENVNKFRNGEYVRLNLNHELLRIRGDIVQTSRGAEVPLFHAKALLRMLLEGKNVVGRHIGSFTLNSIDNIEGDKVLSIGCHRILLSECINVLGKE